MPRPMSPMEMMPTVMARMVVDCLWSEGVDVVSMKEAVVYVSEKEDLAEHARCLIRLVLASCTSVVSSVSSPSGLSPV